jgi:hypothetical protein
LPTDDVEDEEDALDGHAAADTDDEDIQQAWNDYEMENVVAASAAERVRSALPIEKARGFIELEGRTLGRIYAQPRLLPDPSVHISCYRHRQCQQWVQLSRIPDTRLVRIWLQKATDFENAVAHWEATNVRVCVCVCVRVFV